jgi:hypothetical protein
MRRQKIRFGSSRQKFEKPEDQAIFSLKHAISPDTLHRITVLIKFQTLSHDIPCKVGQRY